ncbi:hypothetical protein F5146DRAFT_1141583 [Armillaria mellea]|nr:hypothetical protein F5146DRAFT_1141583 [Armillaria mellea]
MWFTKVNGGDALVKSGQTTICEHPVDQTTFYVFKDTAWISQMSHQNTADSAQTYTLEIGASYNGLTMTMDTQAKVFSDSEKEWHEDDFVECLCKKYRFRDSMLFVLDTSGQEVNAGSPDGDGVLKNEREVEIMSEDYLIVGAMLGRSATGAMDVPSIVRADVEDGRETQNPKDLPAMAKDVLTKMGLKLDAEPANIPPK